MELNRVLMEDFKEYIKPFLWVEHHNSVSVCLNVGAYKNEIFQARVEEGFEGSGYDWCSLAKVFLEEQKNELIETVSFDPEADMFCVYSTEPTDLKAFIIAFKEACEDVTIIQDLFSRAELD